MAAIAAFALCRWLGKHAPQWLDVPPEGNSFVTMAQRGETKVDDLLYRATVRNLRANIARAGFTIVREDLAVSRLLVRNLPRAVERARPEASPRSRHLRHEHGVRAGKVEDLSMEIRRSAD